LTIESHVLGVLYCKLTEAGTRQSVSALVLRGALYAWDRTRFHVARPGGEM
jgi:hypothetical protein